jgi:hypothetical protein
LLLCVELGRSGNLSERLVGLLAASVPVLSNFFFTKSDKPNPLSSAGKASFAQQGKASLASERTKRALRTRCHLCRCWSGAPSGGDELFVTAGLAYHLAVMNR